MCTVREGEVVEGGRVRVAGRVLIEGDIAVVDPVTRPPAPRGPEGMPGASGEALRLVGWPLDAPGGAAAEERFGVVRGVFTTRQMQVEGFEELGPAHFSGSPPEWPEWAAASAAADVTWAPAEVEAAARWLGDRFARLETLAVAHCRVRDTPHHFLHLRVVRVHPELVEFCEGLPAGMVAVSPWILPDRCHDPPRLGEWPRGRSPYLSARSASR